MKERTRKRKRKECKSCSVSGSGGGGGTGTGGMSVCLLLPGDWQIVEKESGTGGEVN